VDPAFEEYEALLIEEFFSTQGQTPPPINQLASKHLMSYYLYCLDGKFCPAEFNPKSDLIPHTKHKKPND
jgi:hypothetical protein